MLGILAKQIRAASSWTRRTWDACVEDARSKLRRDVHLLGDTDSPLGPRVDVHVTTVEDGVILTLLGHDVTGNRAVHIGALLGSTDSLDLVVRSLLDARGKVWGL